MSEELYNSSDYCSLAEQYEELKKENAELARDKDYLMNLFMERSEYVFNVVANMKIESLTRKCKALEADYVISNRELLVKQVEITALRAEIARLKLVNNSQNSYGDFFDRAVIALGFSSATLPTKEAETKMLKRISDLFWLVRNLSDALDCVYGKLPAHWRELPFSYHELKRKVKEVMKNE